MQVSPPSQPVGRLLREWRLHRRWSQLDLASEAEISTRHLSFLETGRASPSRDMVLRLAAHLEVPLRERNVLLLAAGFAPAFVERTLDDPALREARQALDLLLARHKPYPAFVLDRHWNLVAANQCLGPLFEGVAPALLQPPVNVLRLTLRPEGLAPRILNLREWREHLLERLRRQIAGTQDPRLAALLAELHACFEPEAPAARPAGPDRPAGVVVPLRLATGDGVLSFFSTTMVFGLPGDITLSELALESFFPADAATDELVRRLF